MKQSQPPRLPSRAASTRRSRRGLWRSRRNSVGADPGGHDGQARGTRRWSGPRERAARARDLRKGWCPGALRPMQIGRWLAGPPADHRRHGDSAARARHRCMRRDFGNGLIDLSGRANLQLRGVRDETRDPLALRLQHLGLLDDAPEAESVRNVIASPLAGLDARLAARYPPAGRLRSNAGWPTMPRLARTARPSSASCSMTAAPPACARSLPMCASRRSPCDDGACGSPSRSLARTQTQPVARSPPLKPRPRRSTFPRFCAEQVGQSRAPNAPAGLLRAGCRRLRQQPPALYAASDAVAPVGLHPLKTPPPWRSASASVRRRRRPRASPALRRSRGGGRCRDLARRRAALCWLLPLRRAGGPGPGRPGAALRPESPSSHDARLAVAACPGAPACAAGQPTHARAARRWRRRRRFVADGVRGHVSGCAKGCAAAAVRRPVDAALRRRRRALRACPPWRGPPTRRCARRAHGVRARCKAACGAARPRQRVAA